MYRKILVPIDGSHTAKEGLREAIRLAQESRGATIRLLHVLEPLPALQGMEVIITKQVLRNLHAFGNRVLKDAKSLVEQQGIRAEAVFRKPGTGRASAAIIAEAGRWKPDVIVMGTHGRRGISRLVMGSDAEAVARFAPVPVLLIRARRSTNVR